MTDARAPRHKRLVYGKNDTARQLVDLFLPPVADEKGAPPQLLVFLHGGAWVDERNEQHNDLARYIATHANVCVALIEYRLSMKLSDRSEKRGKPAKLDLGQSPHVRHPDHISDVFSGLKLVFDARIAREFGYERQGAVLAGHSVGAWMALAVALNCQHATSGHDDDEIASFPRVDGTVRKLIKAYICSEGIYSLVELLRRYPSYADFVVPAFYPDPSGAQAPYAALTKVGAESWPLLRDTASYYNGSSTPSVHAIHSQQDTLLSTAYNRHGMNLLREKGIDVKIDDESFRSDHDELVHEEAYWRRLIDILEAP